MRSVLPDSLSVILPLMTERRRKRITEVLSKRQPDLTVLAEAIHKPHNLSAILRSCDAVGIGEVHAVEPTGGVVTYSATSASAEKWVSVSVHESIAEATTLLKGQGMTIYAAHFSDTAVDYRSVDYVGPSVILLGNEKHGVSEEAAALADAHVTIPMLGMVPSLNVSVAAAAILFEAQRQRIRAGLYASPRLTPEEQLLLAQQWLPNGQVQPLAGMSTLNGEPEETVTGAVDRSR